MAGLVAVALGAGAGLGTVGAGAVATTTPSVTTSPLAPSPTTPPPVGPTIVDGKDGLSFSLPAGWVQIPLSAKDRRQLIMKALQRDPSLAGQISASGLSDLVESELESSVHVFAVDPESGLSTFGLLRVPPGGQSSVQEFVSAGPSQAPSLMESEGFTHVRARMVATPIGRLLYISALPPGSAPGTVPALEILVVHRGRVYELAFRMPSVSAEDAAAQVMEASWHWR